MALVRRFFKKPDQDFFLFGPKGTGKSTWLKTTFPQAFFVDLLDPETFRILDRLKTKRSINSRSTPYTLLSSLTDHFLLSLRMHYYTGKAFK